MHRIGVFICHCGINIALTVDVKEVVRYVGQIPGVVAAEDYTYMCSEPGQELIREQIKKLNLDRIVVASCSPAMHEVTFRRVVKSAGLNPFCFEMANIREQCSWVHKDKRKSTEKAKAILSAAISRVRLLEPLEGKTVSVKPSVLIVGGGIAGIQASLDIADAGYKVYLVEKESSIGGRMSQLDKTFPTLDCSACILTPKMSEVGNHPNIELLSHSEVEDVTGFIGNFTVTVKKKPRYIDEEKCTGCGDCSSACPVRYEPRAELPFMYPEVKEEERKKVDVIVENYGCVEESLIQILQDINLECGYLPEHLLKYVSKKIDVSLSMVYNVATFYSAFSLRPRGKHTIKVCMGTACYARGATGVLEEIERRLGIKSGETTFDQKFTLETVNCIGCCAIGPVVMVDNEYLTVTPEKVEGLLKKYEQNT